MLSQHCREFISPLPQSPNGWLVGILLFSGTSEPSTEFTAWEKLWKISWKFLGAKPGSGKYLHLPSTIQTIELCLNVDCGHKERRKEDWGTDSIFSAIYINTNPYEYCISNFQFKWTLLKYKVRHIKYFRSFFSKSHSNWSAANQKWLEALYWCKLGERLY